MKTGRIVFYGVIGVAEACLIFLIVYAASGAFGTALSIAVVVAVVSAVLVVILTQRHLRSLRATLGRVRSSNPGADVLAGRFDNKTAEGLDWPKAAIIVVIQRSGLDFLSRATEPEKIGSLPREQIRAVTTGRSVFGRSTSPVLWVELTNGSTLAFLISDPDRPISAMDNNQLRSVLVKIQPESASSQSDAR